MSRPTSASGEAEVSAPLRRGVSPGAEVASGDGQLRHAQRAARASVAEEASSFCVPLCADQFKLVESGGALVSRIDRESDSARQFRECAGSKAGDRGIYASLERKPQAVHLERHCRRDHQKDRSRAGQDGADQTRIHPAQREKEGRCSVKLYTGHTTSYFLFAAEAIGFLILGFVVGLILNAIVPIPSAVIIRDLILKMMLRRAGAAQGIILRIRSRIMTAE